MIVLPTPPDPKRDSIVLATACVLQLAITALDVLVPIGYAEWMVHTLPPALALLQYRRNVAFALAASGIGLQFAGLALSAVLSPADVARLATPNHIRIANRLIGCVVMLLVAMLVELVQRQRQLNDRQNWMHHVELGLSQHLAVGESLRHVADKACEILAGCTDAMAVVLYRLDGEKLVFTGGYAAPPGLPMELDATRGLAGQVARDGRPRVISPAPPNHLPLATALGNSVPQHLLVWPVSAAQAPLGIIEIGIVRPRIDVSGMERLAATIGRIVGLALLNALQHQELATLLQRSREQSAALQMNQEELRVTNEELGEQSRVLRLSQVELQRRQDDLMAANAQMTQYNQALEAKQRELLDAQAELKRQADALVQSNRYKSEFLANMSHELRTPLNSSLILAQLLAENRTGNLDDEQVRFARTIREANADLLTLINDLLDLSKIEAGHANLRAEAVRPAEIVGSMRAMLEPQALQKSLALHVDVDPKTPEVVVTDGRRLQQVLKNLLANALKFTLRGQVHLAAMPATEAGAAGGVRFEVRDTGVGIAEDKLQLIFEAFQQADGSIARQFGGTGLGLSISRELMQRMGGRIGVDSRAGQGSRFWIELPAQMPAPAEPPETRPASSSSPPRPPSPPPSHAGGDAPPPDVASAPAPRPAPAPARDAPVPSSAASATLDAAPTMLVVEDDLTFAGVLRRVIEDAGFRCVVATTGTQALATARGLQPIGVLLDVGLPDVSGLSVLEQLKGDPATRGIPVHVISAHDDEHGAIAMGAVGHAVKPVPTEEIAAAIARLLARAATGVRRVLVVEDEPSQREGIHALLQAPDVRVTAVATIAEALEALDATTFDCMVCDLTLADGSGFELLDRLAADPHRGIPPVIVHTARTLDPDEESRLRGISSAVIIKGPSSPERLLDEVSVFLHRMHASLPPQRRAAAPPARPHDEFMGRRVLLVDDDVRSVFALTNVLESVGLAVEIVRNGREALDRLSRTAADAPHVDLVLMDLMTPEMDGLTATRELRARGLTTPIIAVTAKAMTDDRRQCLEAGANDHIAKPVDVERLISLCRVWLAR